MTTLPERAIEAPGEATRNPEMRGLSAQARSESAVCDCDPGWQHDPSCFHVTGKAA